ncbi:hypothetical protein [Limnochorda pilosa]|uniref:Uncharacterized protein n=1 Tax=Limnochorda pilosa TaxID=1555112 RepID=A0A0K2SQP6_LIMPI|nr:hypothetical protein [Limnochorda pilosa]BAS29317.1 hypothetical protein LIP_3505 [Limnochorda pilosa]
MLDHLQAAVTRRLADWVLVLVGGGFLVLFLELILTGHTEGVQLVGVVGSLAGLLLSLAGLKLSGRGPLRVAALMLLLGLTGLAGTFLHAEERLDGSERAGRPGVLAAQSLSGAAAAEEVRAGERDGRARLGEMDAREPYEPEAAEARERRGSVPPPLAPLSLSGLALLGAVGSAARGSEKKRV